MQISPMLRLLLAYAVISLITFLFYGRDKRLARRHEWRVPEKTLLGLGLLGGAAGALLGMQVFRHKTKHWYFWVLNLFGLVWQAALLAYMAFYNN